MDFDFTPYFQKYEKLVATADAAFERVRQAHSDCVSCRQGCSDCCHALFDLTLIEALYIHHRFRARFSGPERESIEEKSNRIDRTLQKIKRRAYRELQEGRSEEEVLAALAAERVPCPLLSEQELCELYDCRPLTCRFYGIPTAIRGAGHTCGLSGFKPGEKYPTVNLDQVTARLQEISAEILRDMKSKNIRMADMLIPLASALITDFDEVYLGLKEPPQEAAQPKGRGRRKDR
jgi:Fe-S-cluster containining protein